MAMIFDGRSFAKKIETELMDSGRLRDKSLLILSCDGKDTESTYVRLKREQGERLGVKVVVIRSGSKDVLRQDLERLKEDFDGVLIQLPIKDANKEETDKILSLIPTGKDVDGLNPKSSFQPAVVIAVIKILKEVKLELGRRVAVVGSEGMVGRRLMRALTAEGYSVLGFDRGDNLEGLITCETIISATGQAGLIKPEMVREGVIVIDLGYPAGDFEKEVAEKASFFTPVPGGVGPVTVASLYENLAFV